MHFSMKTEYALRAIYEISKGKTGEPVSRRQIADSQRIPIHFLEHILISLKKANLVKSVKGPGGGYALLKKKESISLWDIYHAVDMKIIDGIQCFPGLNC